jgi:hypothetical protein
MNAIVSSVELCYPVAEIASSNKQLINLPRNQSITSADNESNNKSVNHRNQESDD